MRVTINDKEIIFPSSLSEITIGQRIEFHLAYGKELDSMLTSILAMPEGTDKELELSQFEVEKMYRTFAFFAGTTVEAIKESEFLEEVSNIYYSCLAVLFDEEKNLKPQRSFFWQDQEWVLDPPELKHGDKRKFGEFIDGKQLVKDMIELGNGKWEYMLPICCIYLRHPGGAYDESFLYEDSDRLKLMRSLPMDIAMQVGFFFDQHSEYLHKHFEVFWKSRAKGSGKFTKKHFERYGWINFLKTIAESKVFDVVGEGKNSIECVREAPLFDVLIFASEDKSFNEAQALDYQAEMDKMKK